MWDTDFPTQQQMDAFVHFVGSVITSLPRIGLVVLCSVAVVLAFISLAIFCLRILGMRRLLGQKSVFLELTPPATINKQPVATNRLFSTLHALEEIRPLTDKLLQHRVTFSLETVSTREQGIRYVIRVAETNSKAFEKDIAAYMPEVRVRVIEDYVPPTLTPENSRVLDFKQANHFAYPLRMPETLNEEDPMTYPMGAMTQLVHGEQIVFQVVASPARPRATNAIRKKILNNEHLIEHLNGRKAAFPTHHVFGVINKLLFGIVDATSAAYHGPTKRGYINYNKDARDRVQIAKRMRPARTLSAFELELVESIHRKVSEPLFNANIRVLVVSQDKQELGQQANNIRKALGAFTVPKYQSLKARPGFPNDLRGRYRLFMLKHRLPALFNRNSCVLSASELAGLYHFPNNRTLNTENVVKSLSKTLAAPLSLKNGAKIDVLIGRNYYHGATEEIGLTAEERERHVFIVGGTGSGKTTMLQYAIVQDMQNGKGLAVIDPHGDMAEAMLKYVPPERIKDVIYFNPDDIGYPIGLNLLELAEGLTGDDLLREKDLITESVISVFRKIFSEEDTGGHRIEYVLRNTIQTALTVEGATLFTVYELLNDADYRKDVIKTLEDKNLKNFWKNELGKAGDMQKVKMSAGITAKIGRFLFSASAKRILEQPKSTIDFDDIINSGKILICNFSKGLIGEDTSELFGITVLAKLQLASLRRARLAQSEREPFYLYVDEFQNFATQSFVQMLSESRKYRLFMTMAEQSTSQQKDQKMINVILANVGTVICFRTGNPQDEQLLLPLFSPGIEQGEISNLPNFNFYARLSAVNTQEPLSGKTMLLAEQGDDNIAANVIAASRQAFAKQIIPDEPELKPETKTQAKPQSRAQQITKIAKQPASAGMLDVT